VDDRLTKFFSALLPSDPGPSAILQPTVLLQIWSITVSFRLRPDQRYDGQLHLELFSNVKFVCVPKRGHVVLISLRNVFAHPKAISPSNLLYRAPARAPSACAINTSSHRLIQNGLALPPRPPMLKRDPRRRSTRRNRAQIIGHPGLFRSQYVLPDL